MNKLLQLCPVCGERLTVTQLHCRSCSTTIEGHFDIGRLGRLSENQLKFVEVFIRCEGKLNRMEGELGLSYPTLRSRLHEVIRQLGFEVGPDVPDMDDQIRHEVLDDLASGKITSEEAMQLLEGN